MDRIFNKEAPDDLVLLSQTTEEAIVSTLQKRFKQDRIYTYIGDVLLSVNPFRPIPGLYDHERIRKHYKRAKFELQPHVFAVAEDAFRAMLTHAEPQCVLVSGESGAGKTEAAKRVLQYITSTMVNGKGGGNKGKKPASSSSLLSLAVSKNGAGGKATAGAVIKDRLLEATIPLEAFGNAKTLRNNNSSRFGTVFRPFLPLPTFSPFLPPFSPFFLLSFFIPKICSISPILPDHHAPLISPSRLSFLSFLRCWDVPSRQVHGYMFLLLWCAAVGKGR